MSPYIPPAILFNRHVETIYPSLLRKVEIVPTRRERINTPDDDFLDIDWYQKNSRRCVIISHGLEGNSSRAYIKGMARAFFQRDFDVAAWNYRGCSGEMNRQLRFYHSGATDDLRTLVNHVSSYYDQVFLVGFSLGGNLTLKYLGEPLLNERVRKSIVFSAPINLYTSCLEIGKPANWIYSQRFLRSLGNKVKEKAAQRSDLKIDKLASAKTLKDFDDLFTAPLHGFKDAIDYYTQCSSIHFIKNILTPTLMINALNDPFLSSDCYPGTDFTHSPQVNFEYPDFGGHVGFTLFNRNGLYWSEMRALSFIDSE